MKANRIILVICILFASNSIYSQNQNASSCSGDSIRKLDPPILAYIKDAGGNDRIPAGFFVRKFQVALSDTTYSIKTMHLSWDGADGSIYSRPNVGAEVQPEFTNRDGKIKSEFSLARLKPGTMLAIDAIIIVKDGNCYYARAFVVYIK